MFRKALVWLMIIIPLTGMYGQSVIRLNTARSEEEQDKALKKFEKVLEVINTNYVDSVDNYKLTEQAIIAMLRQLDPHSNYFTAEQIKRANEDLEGSFEGIGIEFQYIDDTAMVMFVTTGGPSMQAGLKQGDRILRIGQEKATGPVITNNWISKRVRGEKGTEVILTILRPGVSDPFPVTIIRDRIKTFSIDASFLLSDQTGYIRVNKFTRTTPEEFEEAIKSLNKKGMDNLILDLRGNTGGYMNAAIRMADHFLGRNKLIVYTEGINSNRIEYKSTGRGEFKKGKLIVLIDESSASASEIVTGAVQDWDRGVVMGRRSYGKGLVQKPYTLTDGSVIRLTIARYHTPVGRCIQRPYDKGYEKYYEELNQKIRKGVYSTVDSIKMDDSLRYVTPNGRIVYGGGGIMPDIIVPADTTGQSVYIGTLIRKNMFNRFVLQEVIRNRDSLIQVYPTMEEMARKTDIPDTFLEDFIAFAAMFHIESPEEELKNSEAALRRHLATTLSRLLFGTKGYWHSQINYDIMISRALEVISDQNAEKNLKISQQSE